MILVKTLWESRLTSHCLLFKCEILVIYTSFLQASYSKKTFCWRTNASVRLPLTINPQSLHIIWMCLKIGKTPKPSLVLLIIIPITNGYKSLGILTQHVQVQTHIHILAGWINQLESNSWVKFSQLKNPSSSCEVAIDSMRLGSPAGPAGAGHWFAKLRSEWCLGL